MGKTGEEEIEEMTPVLDGVLRSVFRRSNQCQVNTTGMDVE